ncbi:hypothetical protein TNCV_145631 [Trichonephila clavipes]|nr:hypothetical protein TNCV_145631 [Trichonephila clavipes]
MFLQHAASNKEICCTPNKTCDKKGSLGTKARTRFSSSLIDVKIIKDIKRGISPKENSTISKSYTFNYVGEIIQCSPFSPDVYVSKIASQTRSALIRKE